MTGLFVRWAGTHAATLFLRQLLGVGRGRQRALIGTNRTSASPLMVLVMMAMLIMFDLATVLAVVMAMMTSLMMGTVVMAVTHRLDLTPTLALAAMVLRGFPLTMYPTTALAFVGFLHHIGIAASIRNNLTTSSAFLVAFMTCS